MLVRAAGAVAVVVGLAAVGGLGWWLIDRRRVGAGVGAGAGTVPESPAVASWADAACPACLVLAAAGIEPL
jgi:hypothetical protein